MKKKTYFISGGGTGGHIYPAVAVADELLNLDYTGEIFYIGNPNNLEASIVENKEYKFLPINISGMPRKLSFSLFYWMIKLFFATLKCLFYSLKYKPDVVFGTGGYVSAPALFSAIITNTPFVMHDCDANPGLVTRKLAPFAKSISVAFDVAKEKINNKNCKVNGNPIRSIFSTLTKEQAKQNLKIDKDKIVICIMGGSQGAKTINQATCYILEELTSKYNVQIIFQTGKKNFESTIELLETFYPEFENNKNIIVKPYFEEMAIILKASDIAVSRAGSLSISELCASSVATIYIPYPFAAADHQRKNAKCMVEQNAGIYLEDAETTSEKLLELITDLLNDTDKMQNLQKNASRLAKFDGVENIIKQINEV